MRQAAIFAWRKKINKKQDAWTAHAHCNFQETEKHVRNAAKHYARNRAQIDSRCRDIRDGWIYHHNGHNLYKP